MKKLLTVLAFVLALAVCLDPTRVVLGRLAGESFYAGRPTSYWGREVIRDSARVQEALRLPSPDSVPVLRELLASRSDQVCFFACNALGIIGPGAHSAVPELTEFLRHPNHFYRRNAANALTTVIGPGDLEAVAPLMAVIQENDPWLQYTGSVALGRIGPGAKQAIPVLEALSQGDTASLWMFGKPSNAPDTIGHAASWAVREINGLPDTKAGTESGSEGGSQ
jgi:hypothetical protein